MSEKKPPRSRRVLVKQLNPTIQLFYGICQMGVAFSVK